MRLGLTLLRAVVRFTELTVMKRLAAALLMAEPPASL